MERIGGCKQHSPADHIEATYEPIISEIQRWSIIRDDPLVLSHSKDGHVFSWVVYMGLQNHSPSHLGDMSMVRISMG